MPIPSTRRRRASSCERSSRTFTSRARPRSSGTCASTPASRAEPARERSARKVWFGDAFVECEALDRYALEVGTTVEGPAVIEERESTCVLGPGDRATVGARLNLVAELANEESDS